MFILPGAFHASFARAGSLGHNLDDLYGSKVKMAADGSPLLTVGLMENKPVVRVTCKGRFRVESLLGNGLEMQAGTEVTVRIIKARPAKIRTWVEVASCDPSRIDFVKSTLQKWRKLGYSPRAYLKGGLIDIAGKTLDTRSFSIVLKGYDSRAGAMKAVEDLYRKKGVRASLFEEMLKLPGGRVRVSLSGSGSTLLEARDGVRFRPAAGDNPVVVKSVEYGRGYPWHGFEDRAFRGDIVVAIDSKAALSVINEVSLEHWLKGTVPSEIFSRAAMDALKAQACSARSEALAKLGTRHLADPFMLCASQHCQVYGGVTKEKKRTSEAVDSTRGMVLLDSTGRVLDAVYSAVSGGFTENNDAAWPSPPNPNLRGRPDGPTGDRSWDPFRHGLNDSNLREFLAHPPLTFEAKSSFLKADTFRWTKKLSSRELDALVAKKLDVGHVEKLDVLERGVSGRIVLLRILGDKGSAVVQRELPIRRLFGGLKSAMFVIDQCAGSQCTGPDRNGVFVFRGGGWGHGVGMSQIGAIGRAEAGQDFRQILDHYFSNAGLQRLYGK